MSLLWEDRAVPDHCIFKPLTHALGDSACAVSTFLPIERSKDMIIAALKENYVVAVQSPTSSGKSFRPVHCSKRRRLLNVFEVRKLKTGGRNAYSKQIDARNFP
jgi:hypothetical protein